MANSAQSKKRARQSEKHRQHNVGRRSMLRTYIKKVLSAIASGNKDDARKTYQAAVSVIDRMAKNGIIHKNKASRHKSRLNARIFAMS
ncbi:MAG: 30S ribosomal protein S20 [Thiomargarita sp.]|nr:30S ribosomal protein S20 [Thiomargarita sp.]